MNISVIHNIIIINDKKKKNDVQIPLIISAKHLNFDKH